MTERIRRTERFKDKYVKDDLKKERYEKIADGTKEAAQAFIGSMILGIVLATVAFMPK